MLSTSFKGIQIPKYTDEDLKRKLSLQDLKDYVDHLESKNNSFNFSMEKVMYKEEKRYSYVHPRNINSDFTIFTKVGVA